MLPEGSCPGTTPTITLAGAVARLSGVQQYRSRGAGETIACPVLTEHFTLYIWQQHRDGGLHAILAAVTVKREVVLAPLAQHAA